jgi:hypothetical protein
MAMDEAAIEEVVGSTFRVNTTVLAAGAILVLLGSALFGGALLTAVNRWVKALETPPQETARQKLRQLQSVYLAGARAWREGSGPIATLPDGPTDTL